MLGLSTTYYGLRKLSIYDSVKKIKDLGFCHAELGAGHLFEVDAFEAIKKVKHDFGDLTFTIHQYFPKLFPEPYYFNLCEGLTSINKKIIKSLFMAGRIVESELIGVHMGVLDRYVYSNEINVFGANKFVPVERINKCVAKENFESALRFLMNSSEEYGILVALENIPIEKDIAPLYTFPEEFIHVLDMYNNLGLLLDVGHVFLTGLDLWSFLKFGKKIYEIHLHDYFNETDHLPVGTGVLDLEKFFSYEITKKIPLVFEHGKNVSENEVLKAKKLVESYIL